MPLLVRQQLSPEWHQARIGLITSSTAAGVLWKNPYEGNFATFQEITGRHKKKQSRDMAWGQDNEANAIFAYECETGNLVERTGLWVHPVHHWLGSSPDGLIGTDGGVECKCPGKLPTEIAEHYQIQMRVHMAVLERPWWDFFSWYGHEKFFLCRLERDLAIEADLIAKLDAWRLKYLVPDLAPPRRRPKNDSSQVTA